MIRFGVGEANTGNRASAISTARAIPSLASSLDATGSVSGALDSRGNAGDPVSGRAHLHTLKGDRKMNAYMSDRTTQAYRSESIAINREIALNEARAILGEVEPMRDGYAAADRMYRGPINGPVGPTPEARVALWLSLRAFVADGVQA